MKLANSIVTEKEIREKIGDLAKNEYVDKILKGAEREYLQCNQDGTLSALIKAIANAKTEDSSPIEELQ